MAGRAGVEAVTQPVLIARAPRGSGRLARARQLARRKPIGVVALVIVVVMSLLALLAPLIAPYKPDEPDFASLLASPSAAHPFGTDQLGRDVLTRVIYGTRISFIVGFAVAIGGRVISTVLGVAAGYLGGRTDTIIMRFVDGMLAFPGLILAIALVTALQPSVLNVIIAITITSVASATRVTRSAVLAVREDAYIEAARAMGCSELRIMWRHVLPNITALLIVLTSLSFAAAILVEASLSFLGLGPPPPTPSLGNMLSIEGRTSFSIAPWLAIWPGVAISLAVYAFNMLGDTLRDVLDPRLRGT
jgi:ABC-type dipeptide/oligopeptide/nickel transport system permease subunit